MNQLFFEGKVTNLYAEDYQFLQDSVSEKVQAVIKYLVANRDRSCIVQGFSLSVSLGDNTKFDVRHTGAWDGMGAILSGDHIFFETRQDYTEVSLQDYTANTSTGVYVVLDYIYGSYDRANEVLVEGEKKAVDLYDNTLVYNRKLEKISLAQLTPTQYSLIPTIDKPKYILLGYFTSMGVGAPIAGPYFNSVNYLTSNIVDNSIGLEKLMLDFMLPQRMVSPTSTGGVIDSTFTAPVVDIHDDLNNIRYMIRRIKNSLAWDTPQEGVSGSLPQMNDLWKVGVFDRTFDDAPAADSHFALTMPNTITDPSARIIYYSFNNTATAVTLCNDDSGNGNNGVSQGTASDIEIYGHSAHFTGASRITTPAIMFTPILAEYFRLDAGYATQDSALNPIPTILFAGAANVKHSVSWNKAVGSRYVEFLTQVDANNFVKVSVKGDKIFKPVGQAELVSILVETDFAAGIKRVYINNVLQVDDAGVSVLITKQGSIARLAGVARPYFIGNDGSATNYIRGNMDEYHVFTRTLTPQERLQLLQTAGSAIVGKGSALLGSAVRSEVEDIPIPIPGMPYEKIGTWGVPGSGETVDISVLSIVPLTSYKQFQLAKCDGVHVKVAQGELRIVNVANPTIEYMLSTDYQVNYATGMVLVYDSSLGGMMESVVECFYTYTGPRTDMISLGVAGLSYVAGDIAARPTPKDLPYQNLPLYFIHRYANKNYIETGDVIDVRLQKATVRESTEIGVNDVGCYNAANVFLDRAFWSLHKYSIVATATNNVVPRNTGWNVVAVDGGSALTLRPGYTYQTIMHFQDNDEIWLDLLLLTTSYNITFSLEPVMNSDNFSMVKTLAVRASASISNKSTPIFLHKGFSRGFYRVKITGAVAFTLNRVLIGKYDHFFNKGHMYVDRITAAQMTIPLIDGDLTVTGNLTVLGATTNIDTQNLVVEDNVILVNKNEAGAGVTQGTAGIEVERGSEDNFRILFREADEALVVGTTDASLLAVALRETAPGGPVGTGPVSNGIMHWDAATQKMKTKVACTIDDNGYLYASRVYNAVWNDIAECMPSDGTLRPGDLAQVDLKHSEYRLTKYTGDIDAFIGVVSENPGMIVGENEAYPNKIYVVLRGMVYTDKLGIHPVNTTLYVTQHGDIVNRTVAKMFNPMDVQYIGKVIESYEDKIRIFI
jgi:hypothetical protein